MSPTFPLESASKTIEIYCSVGKRSIALSQLNGAQQTSYHLQDSVAFPLYPSVQFFANTGQGKSFTVIYKDDIHN